MSEPIRRQPSAQDAARSDSPPTPPVERQLPDFQPHKPSPYSPIEREIERSERASAALAAARVLARASFTDSELAADDAAADLHDFETGSWTRTEYAPLDHSLRADDDERSAAPRNLLGGTFNPGIAAQHGQRFPGASIAYTPIRTSSGAHARFAQESRQVPRGERPGSAGARVAPAAPGSYYDRPAVVPMLAPVATVPVPARPGPPKRTRSREQGKLVPVSALVAAVLAVGAGVAWNEGLFSRLQPNEVAMVTPAVAAQAEAARVLSSQQDISIAPAAGLPAPRSDEEIDAALAAAARAAAVPADSVRAAGPALALRPLPQAATPPSAASTPPAAIHAATLGKAGVADAIANAQARADRFLAAEAAASAAAAAPPPVQARPAQ